MKLTAGAIILAIALVALCSLPMVEAATNSYTKTLTTTADLSNNAWYSGYTVSNNQVVLTGTHGEYISAPFTANNLTSGDVSYSSYSASEDVLDYAFLKSNLLWLNSTDARHIGSGHAFYSIRYPFVADGRDFWIVDNSASHTDITLYNGAQVNSVISHPYQGYLVLDGVNDYARAPYTYDYGAGNWYIATMMYSQGQSGTVFGLSDSGTNAYIMVEYVDSGSSDYMKIHCYDQNGNDYSYYTGTVVSPNNWYYVVLRTDSTKFYLYINGVLHATGNIKYNSNSAYNLDYLSLGAIYFGGSTPINFYKGYLDEFRFHAGSISADDCAVDSVMATYMWACVAGSQPTKAANYTSSGAGDGDLYIVANGYSTGTYYIDDISYTLLNTKPVVSSAYPNGIDYPTSDVTLRVTASDVDITYSDLITAEYFVDSVSKGTAFRTTNGDIDKNIGVQTAGSHLWYAIVYDPWNGSITTPTYTFSVPANLYIRDEQDYEATINGSTVTLNFYTENTSSTKTSSNGYVNLYGLPVQNMLVTASADGYYDRKTVITSLYDTNSIYMIRENASVIYNTFKLNTQSISYPVTAYWIDIQKPMNGTVETVFSSYFGFDGSCGTYLIQPDVYRLIIHAPDGSEYAYGWLYPDIDGVMEITISSGKGFDMVTDWLTTSFTVDDEADSITFYYTSDKDIDLAEFIITEDGEVVQTYNVSTNSNTFVYISDTSRHRYFMTVKLTTIDGDTYEVTYPVTLNAEKLNPFPTSYPDWFKQVIVSIVAILFILGFSSLRADIGCLGAAGIFATAYLFDWFPLSLTALFGIILIAMAAAIKFKRRQDKMW